MPNKQHQHIIVQGQQNVHTHKQETCEYTNTLNIRDRWDQTITCKSHSRMSGYNFA